MAEKNPFQDFEQLKLTLEERRKTAGKVSPATLKMMQKETHEIAQRERRRLAALKDPAEEVRKKASGKVTNAELDLMIKATEKMVREEKQRQQFEQAFFLPNSMSTPKTSPKKK